MANTEAKSQISKADDLLKEKQEAIKNNLNHIFESLNIKRD